MTITEFLLARIAEDEITGVHETGCGYDMAEYGNPCRCGWDVRVLAECEAKRRIVNDATNQHTSSPDFDGAVRYLAAVYADHPDYDEAWKL